MDLNLGTTWKLVVSFKPRPPYSRGRSRRKILDKPRAGTTNVGSNPFQDMDIRRCYF